MSVADEPPYAPSVADDFAVLATPKEPGEPLTDDEYAAGARTVKRYWPKAGTPHELPEKYR